MIAGQGAHEDWGGDPAGGLLDHRHRGIVGERVDVRGVFRPENQIKVGLSLGEFFRHPRVVRQHRAALGIEI